MFRIAFRLPSESAGGLESQPPFHGVTARRWYPAFPVNREGNRHNGESEQFRPADIHSTEAVSYNLQKAIVSFHCPSPRDEVHIAESCIVEIASSAVETKDLGRVAR